MKTRTNVKAGLIPLAPMKSANKLLKSVNPQGLVPVVPM